ncbi:hypothetical protein SAMN05428953_103393 [Mesorhizobium muleiense]|uniref:Uncharacterized protein n=2 Tax=Mesorhizobium muleiense TaxID=1004279 RepID=A0A1G8PTY5_9HYPH|nr:hypothetical protein [Mesorhizobium sp.]RWP64046.1 MAG: hypothetical protein EOR07_16805 [Mesorhizobium sp.]SDI96009.1 hypothetical protein SAMN05428953_103393 [Mesorhizobium muleiense]
MFLLHYLRRGSSGLIGEQEKRDIRTVLDLNEYTVKEAVLRRFLFLILISSALAYFLFKAPDYSPTGSALIVLISASALIFLYTGVAVPVTLFATFVSFVAISWMDYQTSIVSICFSALYALYFFAKLRAGQRK